MQTYKKAITAKYEKKTEDPSKIRIKYKGKEKNVPRRYVPQSLSLKDKKKQIKSIINKTERPELESFKNKRSPHVIKFEKKYGFPITSQRVEEIIEPEGIKKILSKGRGAFYSSGSRPEQSADSWAFARLASALTGGGAEKVDKKILDQYLK